MTKLNNETMAANYRKEHTANSTPEPNWSELLKSQRSNQSQLQSQIQSQSQYVEYLPHLANLLKHHISTAPSQTQTQTQTQIRNLRNALRLILSSFSPNSNSEPSTRKILQKEATTETCQIHLQLSRFIAEPRVNSKCRALASRLLCNLCTDNYSTARIVAEEFATSPSELEVSRRMLNVLNVHGGDDDDDYDGNGSGNENGSRNLDVDDSGESSKSCNWSDMISISARAGDRDALAGVAATIHNCLSSLQNDTDNNTNTTNNNNAIQMASGACLEFATKLSNDSMLLSNLIRFILPSQSIQNQTKQHDNDQGDDATDWISLLLQRMSALGSLPQMLSSLGPNSNTNTNTNSNSNSNKITPEQLTFLHALNHTIQQNSTNYDTLGGLAGTTAILTTHRHLAQQYITYTHNSHPNNPKNNDEWYDGEQACRSSAQTILLEILSTSLGQRGDEKDALAQQLRILVGHEMNCLQHTLLKLGAVVDDLDARHRGVNARELKVMDQERDVLLNLVRFVGNLCYRCRVNQDLLRCTLVPTLSISSPSTSASITESRNGLHVLLSCTSFAIGCFTLREWTIVAIRNALEDNDQNQALVEELEARQALNTPELEKMDVKVELDERGKVCVSTKQPN